MMALLEKIEQLKRYGNLQSVAWEKAVATRLKNRRVRIEIPITIHSHKTNAEKMAGEFTAIAKKGQTAKVNTGGFMMAVHHELELESDVPAEQLPGLFDVLKTPGVPRGNFKGHWREEMDPTNYLHRHGNRMHRN